MVDRHMYWILIIILFMPIISISQDNDNSIGTVTVYQNSIDPFVDLDLDSPDHIQESDKLPAPSQVVLLTVQIAYVDNISSEIIVTLVHDDGTGLTSFLNITMLYNSETDSYRANIGGYVPQTQLKYYVESYDGKNRIRTPSSGYSLIIWDVVATTVKAPGGDVIVDVVATIGNNAVVIIAGALLMGFSLMMLFIYMYMNNTKNVRGRINIYVTKRNER